MLARKGTVRPVLGNAEECWEGDGGPAQEVTCLAAAATALAATRKLADTRNKRVRVAG